MTAADRSVAVIGAGSLGGPIAERLLGQGFDVMVCDLDPGRLDALAAKGARVTTSAADCADCATALVVVLSTAQVRDVAARLAARAPGAALARVAVMSTVPPEAVRGVADLLRPSGVAVLDAPNSGGAARALAGRLTIMAGGTAADLDAFAPVFAAIADNVFLCGGLGAGQITKIVNNVICHANTTLTAEVMRLGAAHGLAPEAMARAMEVSTGRNYLTADPADLGPSYGRHTADRAIFDGILTVQRKDAQIAAALAAGQGAGFPMIAGLARLMEELGEETFETWRVIAEGPPEA